MQYNTYTCTYIQHTHTYSTYIYIYIHMPYIQHIQITMDTNCLNLKKGEIRCICIMHRLRYSHSWGLPHEYQRIRIRIFLLIFVNFFFP